MVEFARCFKVTGPPLSRGRRSTGDDERRARRGISSSLRNGEEPFALSGVQRSRNADDSMDQCLGALRRRAFGALLSANGEFQRTVRSTLSRGRRNTGAVSRPSACSPP